MKAIEFKEQNVVFAKDQKEYASLPAHAQQNGMVTFCMKLDKEEVQKILRDKKIGLTVLNFNRPVQPIALHIEKPDFPVDFKLKLNANPSEWYQEKGLALFSFDLDPEDVAAVKKYKVLWITTLTFGTPLQPISHFLS